MHANNAFLLFLPALPAGATRHVLKQFVREGLSASGYRGLARAMAISRCSIIRVTDPASGTSELHGIVRVRPAKAAMDVMETLQGRTLLGEPMQVRRYLQRTQLGVAATLVCLGAERRRSGLRLELIDS
jgi:hypothetical protein